MFLRMEEQNIGNKDNVNTARRKEIHSFISAVCALGIMRHVISIFTSIAKLVGPESFTYNGMEIPLANYTLVWLQLLCSIALIVAFGGVLSKKKWGVLGFFFIQFVGLVIGLTSGDTIESLILCAVWCGAFSLILLLRKNGESAWKTIFKKVEDNDSHPNKAQEKTSSQTENTDRLILNGNTDTSNEGIEKNKEESFVCDINDVENKKEILTTGSLMDDIQETGLKSSRLSVEPTEKDAATQKCKEKFVLIGVICWIVVLLTSVFIGIYFHNNTPEKKYAKADKLFSEGSIDEAIAIYTELADKENYTNAQTRLGMLYLVNDSIPLDTKKGFSYLEKAVLWDTTALSDLITIYSPQHLCKGTDLSDIEKYKHYAELAVKQGKCLGLGYFALGNYYADKKGDYSLAYYYWNKAAEHGNYKAFANIGWLFYYGNGCAEDNDKARYYFEKAIEHNKDDSFSLYYLGEIYRNGYGVPIDLDKAKDFYKRSAELGNDYAQKEYANFEIEESTTELLIKDLGL